MEQQRLNIWFPPEAWPYLHNVSCSLLNDRGQVIATKPVTGKAIVDGAADADDVDFGRVETGHQIAAVRVHAGERGIARWQLDLATNSGCITIVWDNGHKRMFLLELP